MQVPPEAFYDLYFLLSRGYSRPLALRLVAQRYALRREEAVFLNRCVHSRLESRAIAAKLLKPADLKGGRLAIDGFNQFTTIYAAAEKHTVYRCSDGLTRDALLSGAKAVTQGIQKIVHLIRRGLEELAPAEAVIVLDSQPSKSGEVASYLRKALRGAVQRLQIVVSRRADTTLIELSNRESYVVASSDIVVAKRARKLFDFASYILQKDNALGGRVNNIPQLLEKHHKEWCRGGGPVA
ncbi:MAG: DUF434 domain-containing protein [Thermoproteota archaeon]